MTMIQQCVITQVTFNGGTAAGEVSVPGTKVGDVLLVTTDLNGGDENGVFSLMVDQDDHILQTLAANISGSTFVVVLSRLVSS